MKKFLNRIDNVVDEMLKGLVKAYPTLRRVDGAEVIVRADKKIGKVALVSGGGSGHEPSHAGFVGTGMLDGAVAGAVFTSPTPDQVYEAIKAVGTDAGVLLVIKNYTGDVMNFEMAAEMAEAEGIKVDKVIVADDVAVENSTWTVGQRGIAGTIFVHKIAGAAAERGADLAEVKRIAEKVCANMHSMGVSLTPCTVPAAGKPSFELAENEMEVGLGIHGEPGTHRAPIETSKEVVDHLLAKILANGFVKNEEVVVLVNGLGGTPQMELCVINNDLHNALEAKGIKIYKTLLGNYMTSLEMAGFSITVLKVDAELKALLDAPAKTPAYQN
jgi:phosphoenolpyruvate---glycerone phosphotransferase subunit DhaK